MPDLNITSTIKKAIDGMPERAKPLLLSRNKVAAILLDEAIEARRKKLQKGPKLRDR